MKSRINKWGDSAAILIPANVLAVSGLSVNSAVSIDAKDGRIIIERLEPCPKKLKLPFSEASLLRNLDWYTAHADEVSF